MLWKLRRWRTSRQRYTSCFIIAMSLLLNFALSQQAVRSNLQEALRVANGNGTEAERTEARIEADVYEALQAALSK